jgi:glutathione S-transferase
LKLFIFPVAPNPTRVRLYLAEKREGGATPDVEEVTVNLREKEQNSPRHRLRNPLEKLPVLEIADGEYLTESSAIIEYLEELAPTPSMIGTDATARARTREWDRIVEIGILRPIVEIVHATVSPLGLPPNPEVAAHCREQLSHLLDRVNERLADGRPMLMGDAASIADCTLAAALQFGRMGQVEIPASHEHIARWDRTFRQRASAQQVLIM